MREMVKKQKYPKLHNFNNMKTKRTIYNKNKYIDKKYYYEIILYNRECKEIAKSLIDKNNYDKVKDYKWCLNTRGYVSGGGRNKILLHQLILGKKGFFVIDHINGDKLDNRKINLRHCTQKENTRNTKAKGVCFHKVSKKWQSQITVNYKAIHLGLFNKKEDALKKRREAELKYFNEFAYKYE